MKAFLAFILVGAVAAFYLGYSPSDLVALWPSGGGGSNPPPKDRRAETRRAAAAEPAQPAAPIQRTGGSTVVVGAPDGSLESRWKP